MTITIKQFSPVVIVTVMVIIITGIFLTGARAQTASPQFMITWQSRTYVPPGFEGKILPTANSLIMVSFELIDEGKPADMSAQTVYWYANNNFLKGGKGLRHIEFRAPDTAGGTIDLRAEVPNYKRGPQLKTIGIPIVSPKAVIEAPFPNNEFSASPIQLTGLPYFFNVRDISALNFDWRVNGVAPAGTENPDVLTVRLNQDAPSGSPLGITFAVRNKNNALEGASVNVNLIYKP
ncbi:MAG: hypothetical protein HY433_00680 [Candidatus Liptonbacteria bacterium]|nr:hypothetical protein [Candidatus Liptonbacteria bacterium]